MEWVGHPGGGEGQGGGGTPTYRAFCVGCWGGGWGLDTPQGGGGGGGGGGRVGIRNKLGPHHRFFLPSKKQKRFVWGFEIYPGGPVHIFVPEKKGGVWGWGTVFRAGKGGLGGRGTGWPPVLGRDFLELGFRGGGTHFFSWAGIGRGDHVVVGEYPPPQRFFAVHY